MGGVRRTRYPLRMTWLSNYPVEWTARSRRVVCIFSGQVPAGREEAMGNPHQSYPQGKPGVFEPHIANERQPPGNPRRAGLRILFDPGGRSSRGQYAIVTGGYFAVLAAVASVQYFSEPIFVVVLIFSIVPLGWIGYISIIRRLHDLDRSGWWVLLVVCGSILSLIYLLAAPGRPPGTTRWG